MIPCTKNFTKETFLGRLEAIEFDLKKYGKLAKVETTFSALSVRPCLERSTSAQGDIASNNRTLEEKINEGVTLLMEKEVDVKEIYNVGHVMSMVIMHLSVLKEKRSLKEDSDPEELEIA